jgi:hypothetical protein
MNDNSNQDKINQHADDILKRMNDRMLAMEYERGYDILSRLAVWFASPPEARKLSARAMYEMVRDFMETAHSPYDDFDVDDDSVFDCD